MKRLLILISIITLACQSKAKEPIWGNLIYVSPNKADTMWVNYTTNTVTTTSKGNYNIVSNRGSVGLKDTVIVNDSLKLTFKNDTAHIWALNGKKIKVYELITSTLQNYSDTNTYDATMYRVDTLSKNIVNDTATALRALINARKTTASYSLDTLTGKVITKKALLDTLNARGTADTVNFARNVSKADGTFTTYGDLIVPKARFEIGDTALGGIVGYVNDTSVLDSFGLGLGGGLVVTLVDITGEWYLSEPGSDLGADDIYDGQANTDIIIASPDPGAAKYCDTLNSGGYSDWYLPAINQLEAFNINIDDKFDNTQYYSSTEYDATFTYVNDFNTNSVVLISKFSSLKIKCVRDFNAADYISTNKVELLPETYIADYLNIDTNKVIYKNDSLIINSKAVLATGPIIDSNKIAEMISDSITDNTSGWSLVGDTTKTTYKAKSTNFMQARSFISDTSKATYSTGSTYKAYWSGISYVIAPNSLYYGFNSNGFSSPAPVMGAPSSPGRGYPIFKYNATTPFTGLGMYNGVEFNIIIAGREPVRIDTNMVLFNRNIDSIVQVSKIYMTDSLGTWKEASLVADDGTITLPAGIYGDCKVMAFNAGSVEAVLHVMFNSDASIPATSIFNYGFTDRADTDGSLCIYDGGSTVIIKNRLGGSRMLQVIVNYKK